MLTSMAVILLFGLGLAYVFEKLQLPPLLGMVIAGIIIGPHALSMLDDSMLLIAPDVRQLALVIILTRAGLSLHVDDIKQVGRPAFFMSFIPACFEIGATMLLGTWLFSLNIVDACLLGCVIAAVSPAVIVPNMISLMEQGYGCKKRIPQLILAGASLDDIFVIVLFSSILTMAQGGVVNWLLFLRIPISLLLGVGVGVLCALTVRFVCKRWFTHPMHQILVLFLVSFLLIALQNQLTGVVSISALVAIMVMGMTLKKKDEQWAKQLHKQYSLLWKGAEIFLFVLVGIEVNLNYVAVAGWLAGVLIVGALLIRMIGVACCLVKTNLNAKERFFCMGAYTPKATVQAAIGSIPLSVGLAGGQLILTIAVLSILISAPIGAIFIDKTYRHLLTK